MLDKFNNLINPILNILSVIFFIAFFIAMDLGIIFRFLNYPLFWIEEFCRYLFIWAILIEVVILVNKKQNIGVDWFIRFFPKKFKKALTKIVILMQLIFVVLLTYYGIRMMILTADISIPSLKISWSIVYLGVVVASFLMSISFFFQLFYEK